MTDYEFEMMIAFYEEEYKAFLELNGLTEEECSFDNFIASIVEDSRM